MPVTKRKSFKAATLEKICNILADTGDGLTGSQIHNFLLNANIDDVSANEQYLAKRHRLYNAFVSFQNQSQCSNHILKFIQLVVNPTRFVDNPEKFGQWRIELNKVLAFEGYELAESGKFRVCDKASTLSDIEIKAANLKQEMDVRNAHPEIYKYCTPELLQNNYFHAVFESCKGLFDRIRTLSGLTTDGNALIEQVFSKDPILAINAYTTDSEKNEHCGFANLLKGLCSMFRNTTAHEAKIEWPIEEQDALEILGIISYCHRRLDKAKKIK